jgi:hypothetical protein
VSNEEKILGELIGLKGELSGISQRLSGIEGRLTQLQWIGSLMFAGLLGSYAGILTLIVR